MRTEEEPVFGWRALRRLLGRRGTADNRTPPPERARAEEDRERWATRARVVEVRARLQITDRER